jgi:AmiR/NasT family two-component response regulator
MTSTPSVGTRRETNLTILLADEDEDALRSLGDVLRELGHEVTPFAVSVEEALELITREDPDVAIVVVHKNDDHALSLIREAVETASGPVIAQLRRRDDVDFVARAAEHGISAYVESDDPQDVQAAIEVSIRRYREAARLNGDRARQGHPDGAPRRRRARGVRPPARPRAGRQPPRRGRRDGRGGRPRAAAGAPGQGLTSLASGHSRCQ